ncbi:mitochondrial uncoupling protein 4-like [Pectinophora gossypiella]|uniref:mitochondrial uncoupling protein 4-like n=1 Tax=Pectinophora gossypiella TaxID=13191 RepID=UPI00214DF7B3|nr:mitochondrial uncoupling protein 4-like [Pectinophora gossypiella]
MAGSLAQLVASPADLVKVQMQAEGRRVLQGLPPRCTNLKQAYAKIYTESGLLGFFRGSLPNMQRAALVNMGDLAAYDYTKKLLINDFGMPDSTSVHACAALIAGLTAAILGTPADLIKTRLMNQPVGPNGRGLRYAGMVDCFRQSVKNEGILSLYNGFIPNWLRMGPWALINWVVFENIMIAVGEKTF